MAGELLTPAEFAEDEVRESCAVALAFNKDGNAPHLVRRMLLSMQNRGEHSSAIATRYDSILIPIGDIGLVKDVYTKHTLGGFEENKFAIGGNRYGTYGKNNENDPGTIAPIVINARDGKVKAAIMNNGEVRVGAIEMAAIGMQKRPPTDTVYIAELYKYVLDTSELSPIDALKYVAKTLDGAFSLGALIKDGDEETLVALRDRNGFWPLSYGKLPGGGFVVASETGGIEAAGAIPIREIDRGKMILINETGIKFSQIFSRSQLKNTPESRCFLGISYMDEEDNVVFGETIERHRERLGRQLARQVMEQNPELLKRIDVVIGVPDSGNFAALGFHRESGIPIGIGLKKNRYSGRGFMGAESDRSSMMSAKYRVMVDEIMDKRLGVIDDSVVRGETTKETAKNLSSKGAREIHVLSTTPCVISPCFYGVNIKTVSELIAAGRNKAQIALELGVDSITYLEVDRLQKQETVGNAAGRLCTGCMTRQYPTLAFQRV